MKKKHDVGDPEDGRSPRVASSSFKKKQKGKRRLGGGGLSLEAFAAAKSKPKINPAQIREHREFYQNAKKILKYKKLVKQIGGQGSGVSSQLEAAAENPDSHQYDQGGKNESGSKNKALLNFSGKKLQIAKTDGKDFRKHRKRHVEQRHSSELEKIREQYQKERFEREEKRRQQEALYAEQQVARDKARRERKELQERLRKKTRRGQPVMKHQMEFLLKAIQRG